MKSLTSSTQFAEGESLFEETAVLGEGEVHPLRFQSEAAVFESVTSHDAWWNETNEFGTLSFLTSHPEACAKGTSASGGDKPQA